MSEEYSAGDTWVIKVGSSLLTNYGKGMDRSLVQAWVDDIAYLHHQGKRVVLVSSGAVAEGMQRLGFSERPRSLQVLQAAAAVGQMKLVEMYESSFQRHHLQTAQVLLTHADLSSRERYLNARNTLKQLLNMQVVPVANENDTVVTDEIKFGDNDTLAALVANLIEAQTLLLLTDQPGFMSANPMFNDGAELIKQVEANNPELDVLAGGGSEFGRGGMLTKLAAARIAARSGASTVIASGREPSVIKKLYEGQVVGTLLTADRGALAARKQWLATLPICGKLRLDAGACDVLKMNGRSLLPVGVVQSLGEYSRGDLVVCIDAEDHEIARGLINYPSDDVEKLCGVSSDSIETVLGYVAEAELIHRDNLVVA